MTTLETRLSLITLVPYVVLLKALTDRLELYPTCFNNLYSPKYMVDNKK